MFEEPLTTIQQAKEFFRAMGCSHFHMDREYPARAHEYRQLGITDETERKWIEEQFDEYYASIRQNTNTIPLWNLYSRMYDLLLSIRTNSALLRMLEATRFIRDIVPQKDRIIIAEIINGRTVRSTRQGLIYISFDWNHIPAAKEFTELSLHFSQYDEQQNRGFERCQESIQLCNDIKLELGL